MGIGDWGLGIGDWGLGIGPNPNPQSPIPNPQSPNPNRYVISYIFKIINKNFKFKININIEKLNSIKWKMMT